MSNDSTPWECFLCYNHNKGNRKGLYGFMANGDPEEYVIKITEEKITTENNINVTAYGICIKNKNSSARVDDISTDKLFVERIAKLCKTYRVSPIHLKDVVEDQLALNY